MFGFKKKKKTGGEKDLLSASNSPASFTEKKSSKGSRLPFGRKSSKSKKIDTGSISSSDVSGNISFKQDKEDTNVTNVEEHKISKQDLSNGKTKSQNLAPGFQVLGQLASDLEALQRRRESEGKVSLTSSTSSHSKDIQVKEPVRKKAYELKPPEEWAENEVLDWLRDKDLGYFVELFDGKLTYRQGKSVAVCNIEA